MKVFWSWQSDTPGKTGRHFIRDALEQAIAKLKQAPDVEEPAEREAREALHIDQDRQDVRGSPELARTILSKIAASTVFVADVTPVSTIPASADGKRAEKRNMNPNVALELGYALHARTYEGVLLVLNTQYGGREFLPFDLAHLGGPILFDLPEDADKPRRSRELARLTGLFVTALRPYIDQAPVTVVPGFSRAPETISAAAYWKPSETLAQLGEGEDQASYFYPDGSGFYLRVIPTRPKDRPFPRSELLNIVERSHLQGMSRKPTRFHRNNDYGSICFDPSSPRGGELVGSTQVFLSGELWGNAPWLFSRNRFQRENLISKLLFEACYQRILPLYICFMQRDLEMEPPYTVIAGAAGIQSFKIVVQDTGQPEEDLLGPIHDDDIRFERVLNDSSTAAINAYLLEFFEWVFKHTGYSRPG